MFKVYAVVDYEIPPYRSMMADAALMLRPITAAQMCFYITLLLVKMSLVTLYRKLLTGLPKRYLAIWWAILTFCVIASAWSIDSSIRPLTSPSLGSVVFSAAHLPAMT